MRRGFCIPAGEAADTTATRGESARHRLELAVFLADGESRRHVLFGRFHTQVDRQPEIAEGMAGQIVGVEGRGTSDISPSAVIH